MFVLGHFSFVLSQWALEVKNKKYTAIFFQIRQLVDALQALQVNFTLYEDTDFMNI